MLLGLEGVSATTSAVLTESAVVSSGSSRVVGRVAAAAVVWYWCSDYVAIAVAVA